MSIYDNVAAGLKLNGYSNRRVLDEIVERSLKNSALWDEVKDDLKKEIRRQPVRRPAAAAVHCARSGGRSRGVADGRACLRARPRFHVED
jgi:hypothetical protein